ncbi:MAG: hypothetical protein DRP52_01170 [Planctomycetota bacterium]|nr:MAG: hypothetical protein DRP52_01170 [Planctomycetota bacterium]
MNIRRFSNPVILLFLTALTVFSVFGAFIGAGRAGRFFNSTPLALFWCLLFVFFITGFFVYASLRKNLVLMTIHAGCILVLAGGMAGSAKGRLLFDRLFDEHSFTRGAMSLHRGQSSHRVSLETGIAEMPFAIRLKDAFIEYYDTPSFHLNFRNGSHFDIPAEVGQIVVLPDGLGIVEVVKAYQNFKMKQVNGRMTPYESAEPGSNPAYELTLTPDGKAAETFYVFERLGMHAMSGRDYRAEYVAPRMVKDYKSILQVIDKGEVVRETTIEVNKPLYYGGYHFYQNTFAYDDTGPISGISITSVRGVWAVFVGYAMVFIGLVLRFWPKLLKGWGNDD